MDAERRRATWGREAWLEASPLRYQRMRACPAIARPRRRQIQGSPSLRRSNSQDMVELYRNVYRAFPIRPSECRGVGLLRRK